MSTLDRLLRIAPTVAVWAVLAFLGLPAQAEGSAFKVPTREGVTTTVFWESAPNATATLLLFPGGGGGFGRIQNGRPTSDNFLVRTVPEFIAQGFNVAIFGKPSDLRELDYEDRITDAHLSDVAHVIDFVKQQSAAPIWLVGTSRGTVSVAAAGIHIHDPAVAGLVLTSSVVNPRKAGALPTQDLAAITLPVLVLHHTRDACPVCEPRDVPAILAGLSQAPVKKLVMVSGGGHPSGGVCAPLHWHGYVGMEVEAVHIISRWIERPAP